MHTYSGSLKGIGPRGEAGRSLEEGLDSWVLDDVVRQGVAVVRGALSHRTCQELLAEAEAGPNRFLSLPGRVNGVSQRAEQLIVPIGDTRHPGLVRLIGTLCAALAAQPHTSGAHRFAPTEARYMRYTGQGAGLGVHRDGKCYAVLVCVFTLAGSAPFTVFGDDGEPSVDLLVHAGDLVLLRGPGLGGTADGRPRHAVGAPLGSERVSLTLRTVRGILPPR